MLRKEGFAMIKSLHERGVHQVDIAAQLGVHRKTVSRALKRGGASKGARPARGSNLDPFRAQVDQLLAEGVWNAVVILRETRSEAKGYTGGQTVLRQYVGPKRVLRANKATVRFETEPGRQLQSDWSVVTTLIAGQAVKAHFSVNTLGYSRRFHFWCTDSEDAEHTYEGLVRSFEYFGGVPHDVLVDNQKAAVLQPVCMPASLSIQTSGHGSGTMGGHERAALARAGMVPGSSYHSGRRAAQPLRRANPLPPFSSENESRPSIPIPRSPTTGGFLENCDIRIISAQKKMVQTGG